MSPAMSLRVGLANRKRRKEGNNSGKLGVHVPVCLSLKHKTNIKQINSTDQPMIDDKLIYLPNTQTHKATTFCCS